MDFCFSNVLKYSFPLHFSCTEFKVKVRGYDYMHTVARISVFSVL